MPKFKKRPGELTGLWKTKTRNLYVGGLDDMKELISVIKEAKSDDKGITFFLWRQEDAEGKQPKYRLNVAVARDRDEEPKKKSRAIEPDEDDGDEDEDEDEESDDEIPF